MCISYLHRSASARLPASAQGPTLMRCEMRISQLNTASTPPTIHRADAHLTSLLVTRLSHHNHNLLPITSYLSQLTAGNGCSPPTDPQSPRRYGPLSTATAAATTHARADLPYRLRTHHLGQRHSHQRPPCRRTRWRVLHPFPTAPTPSIHGGKARPLPAPAHDDRRRRRRGRALSLDHHHTHCHRRHRRLRRRLLCESPTPSPFPSRSLSSPRPTLRLPTSSTETS